VYFDLAGFSANMPAQATSYVRAGTYIRNTGTNIGALHVSRSGIPSARTVVQAYPGEELLAVICTDSGKCNYNPDPSQGADGNAALSAMYYPNAAIYIAADYVDVKGFKTYGMTVINNAHDSSIQDSDIGGGGPGTYGGTQGQGQTVLITTAYNILVKNNKIHHSCRATDGLPGNQNGPALMGYDFSATIENNEFHDNWYGDIRLKDVGGQQGRTTEIRYNLFKPSSIYPNGNGVEGIGQDGNIDYVYVHNNIFYNKHVGIGWAGSALVETVAYGNTFINNVNHGIDSWATYPEPGIRTYNNLFYHSSGGSAFDYYFEASSPAAVLHSDYNMFYAVGGASSRWRNGALNTTSFAAWQAGGYDGHSINGADPSFLDVASCTAGVVSGCRRSSYVESMTGSPYGNHAGAYETGNECIGLLSGCALQSSLAPSTCGNPATCDSGETCQSCPADCGSCCSPTDPGCGVSGGPAESKAAAGGGCASGGGSMPAWGITWLALAGVAGRSARLRRAGAARLPRLRPPCREPRGRGGAR